MFDREKQHLLIVTTALVRSRGGTPRRLRDRLDVLSSRRKYSRSWTDPLPHIGNLLT